MKSIKATPTQQAILRNIAAGRPFDQGRAYTQSASAGWGQSRWSCLQRGWLVREGDYNGGRDVVTPAGRAAAGLAAE